MRIPTVRYRLTSSVEKTRLDNQHLQDAEEDEGSDEESEDDWEDNTESS